MKQASVTTLVVLLMSLAAPSTAAIWQVPGDFATIQEAIDSSLVIDGDRIMVGPGNHAGAYVTKSVEIWGEGGATIDSGPMHPAGLSMGFRFLAGSDGATINHLTFEVDLAIMNGAGVSDVTVSHCTFNDTIQAVSNWMGNGWEISHNVITDLRTQNGGGIGILIADSTGGYVMDNVVSHNQISGTLHVFEGDGGGYAGSGIVLYADWRWGASGSASISFNRVVKNRISMVSDTPAVVDIAAFELTEAQNPSPEAHVVTDNSIGFNDFRGTENQITLSPETLDNPVNFIDRNLGDNRGHPLYHPSVFGPGGN
ncbi:hypothetical protein JXA47_04980 [Candidatus Sumerlaeota bacterium]|nr:hypothetical protein [Candidatus Sumerlaeota bacterium]